VDRGSLTQRLISPSAASAILPTLVTVIKDWLLRQPPKTTLRLKEGNFDFQWTGTTSPSQIEETLMLGIPVLARTRPERDVLEGAANGALALLRQGTDLVLD
jgi:hypothetical protein